MAPSPPLSGAVDVELSCMPRRQSCDRCHEQKVRCVTEKVPGSVALGDITEEATQNPGGSVISPVPCVRCRKAGAVCIYSPQLRSGRPRRRQDSRVPPPRRRGRRTSRSSSSSSIASPEHRQPSPAALPNQASTFTESPSSIPLGTACHPAQELLERDPGTRETPCLPSSTANASWQPNIHLSTGTDAPPLTEQWRPPLYHIDDPSSAPVDTCGLASFAAVPAMSCAPVFPQPANAVIPTTDHNFTCDYPWSLPSSPESYLEQLSHINLRIHLGGRSLPEPSTAIAPWSSPAVNDLLGAACSLANTMDRYAAGKTVHSRDTEGGGVRSTLEAALESSTCLALHACHQAIFGALDHISIWLLLYLSQPPQQQTPPATPPHPAHLPTYDPQAAVMTNFMVHLLNELNRTFWSSPIITHTQLQQHSHQHHTAASPDAPPVALGQGMPNPGPIGNANGHWKPPDVHSGHIAWQGVNKGLSSLLHDAECRHTRVRERLVAVGELLRQRNIHLRQ